MVYQLFYISKSTKKLSNEEINKILETAHGHNSGNGLTGILLSRRGTFLQLLEGDRDTVRALFDDKIRKDKRHTDVIEIFAIEQNERLFSDWSMACHEVTDLDVRMVNEFLSWNRLLMASKNLDNNLILEMLTRFKRKLPLRGLTKTA